ERRIFRQRRIPSICPFLPTLAQYRPFQAIGTVDAPLHGKSLGTGARIPSLRRAILVQIAVALMVVVLLAANHDPVAYKGPQPAHVSIVRGADPGETVVVAILVEVDLLPVAVRIAP